MSWIQIFFFSCVFAYVADQIYFSKKRAQKYWSKLKRETVNGIIAELKASDTTLVIDSFEHGMKIHRGAQSEMSH